MYTYASGIDMKGFKKWPETVTRRVHPLLLFLKVRKPQIPRFKIKRDHRVLNITHGDGKGKGGINVQCLVVN